MAKDQKRRQAKIMKKKRKDKTRAQKQRKTRFVASAVSIIRKARDFPLRNCWITSEWDTSGNGIASVVVTREQPNGLITWGAYLVDLFCLGVKDATANANFLESEIRDLLLSGMMVGGEAEEIAPELAHQIIYQAIDYAAQFGFKPHRDFKLARYVLEPRGAFEETHPITFGRNGKPLFIPGPHDNVEAILARLNENPGPGNYDYLINISPFDEWDDLADFDEDEYDDA